MSEAVVVVFSLERKWESRVDAVFVRKYNLVKSERRDLWIVLSSIISTRRHS